MIYVVFALIALCIILFSALIVLGAKAEERLDRVLREHVGERSKLLDRIQFPEVRQVEAILDSKPPEIPKDAAELAFVGQEVPTGYDVGGDE